MQRRLPVLIGALVLLALVVGSAFAAGRPAQRGQPAPLAASPAAQASDAEEADENDADDADAGAPLADDAAAGIVDRLSAAGLDTDAATLQELAASYGVGGAVRLLGWADETGKTVDEIAAMRDAGAGWGQIARDLGVHPGIGRYMSGGHSNGLGPANAPGQAKKP